MKKEIQNIRLSPADNGGVVLTYCIYTPSHKNSESTYDDKTLIYSEEEIESKMFPKIMDLYREQLASFKNSKPMSGDMPVSGY